MRYQEVINLLKRRPFRPLKFHFSNGDERVVRHPEMAIVDRSTVFIGEESSEVEGLAEEIVFYSLIHLVKVELLQDGRGEPARATTT